MAPHFLQSIFKKSTLRNLGVGAAFFLTTVFNSRPAAAQTTQEDDDKTVSFNTYFAQQGFDTALCRYFIAPDSLVQVYLQQKSDFGGTDTYTMCPDSNGIIRISPPDTALTIETILNDLADVWPNNADIPAGLTGRTMSFIKQAILLHERQHADQYFLGEIKCIEPAYYIDNRLAQAESNADIAAWSLLKTAADTSGYTEAKAFYTHMRAMHALDWWQDGHATSFSLADMDTSLEKAGNEQWAFAVLYFTANDLTGAHPESFKKMSEQERFYATLNDLKNKDVLKEDARLERAASMYLNASHYFNALCKEPSIDKACSVPEPELRSALAKAREKVSTLQKKINDGF